MASLTEPMLFERSDRLALHHRLELFRPGFGSVLCSTRRTFSRRRDLLRRVPLLHQHAALLQFLQAVAEVRAGQANRVDRFVTAIQLGGTLFFNVTTFTGMNDALSTHQKNLRVWAPDVFGSICFLVASGLAFRGVCGAWWCKRWNDRAWRMSSLNMLGSIFFGVAAITSFFLPDTGELLNTAATNTFTFLGAVCFLLGARLLIPAPGEVEVS